MKVQGAVADTGQSMRTARRAMPASVQLFVEMPGGEDLPALVGAAADIGVSAKFRTGGVTGDAFPPARQVARFLRCCAEHAVSFKATAGLHHPLRGQYSMTYEPNAAS